MDSRWLWRSAVFFSLWGGILFGTTDLSFCAEAQKAGQVAKASLSVESAAPQEPSAEQLRQTIRDYIAWQEKALGSFMIPDSKETGRLRSLSLIRVHERVGKTGDYYYSCTDMEDIATGDQLDLDFDVANTGEELKVVAVRIHKDNGKPRYTYDANDRLVQLSE